MYYRLAVIRRFNTLILQIVLRAKLLFALICPSYTTTATTTVRRVYILRSVTKLR